MDDNKPPPVVVVVSVAQQLKRVSSSFEQVLTDFEVKYGRDASVREVAHWNNTISRASIENWNPKLTCTSDTINSY